MLYVSNAIWLILFFMMIPSTWRIIRGKGHGHDVLRFSFALVGLVMFGFGARWMFAPDNFIALDVMRVFSAMLAVFLMIIARFYRKWG